MNSKNGKKQDKTRYYTNVYDLNAFSLVSHVFVVSYDIFFSLVSPVLSSGSFCRKCVLLVPVFKNLEMLFICEILATGLHNDHLSARGLALT